MPPHMKLIARYGNGACACFFAGLVLYALGHGAIVFALFWVLVCGLAAFNFLMFEKVSALTSQEVQFTADLSTAALRPEIAGHSMDSPETVVRNHGL